MTSGAYSAPVRTRLQASLRGAPTAPPPPGVRPFAFADVPELARVMWDAYRGTADEADVGGPEGAAREIELALGGEYGAFLPGASVVAEDQARGRPAGAALVTLYRDVPLLAFLFVGSSHAGRGVGRNLVRAAMHVLAEQGHDTLSLAVTRRNRRARRLYDRLGFVEVV